MRIAGNLAAFIAGAAITAAPVVATVAAPTASAACHGRHALKCELHREESRLHIPHHIRHGIRW